MSGYEYAVVDGFCDGDHPDDADGYLIYDSLEEAEHAALSYGGLMFIRFVGDWLECEIND